MKLSPRCYKQSLLAISLVALPWLAAFMPLVQVVLAQELRLDLGLVAQGALSRHAEANQLFLQGIQLIRSNRYREASQLLERALEIYKEVKNPNSLILSRKKHTSFFLSNVYMTLGQYQKLIDTSQQWLTISKQSEDILSEGNALNSLGNGYYSLGQSQKAIGFYQQSLAIAKKINDLGIGGRSLNRGVEGRSLNGLGNAYSNLGQYEKAIEYYRQSLAIFKQIGDTNGEGGIFGSLGGIYLILGQYDKAIEYYNQSLAIFKLTSNTHSEAAIFVYLGGLYLRLGQYQKTVDYYQKALAVFKQIGDLPNEGITLSGLASVYIYLEEYRKAIDYFQKSLAIAKQIGDRNAETASLSGLGIAYTSLGEDQKAIDHFQQSLTIARQINDLNGEGSILNGLGNTYYSLGEYQKAIDYFRQSLDIAKKIGDRYGLGASLNDLGRILDHTGNLLAAEQVLLDGLQVWESLRATSGNDTNKISVFERQSVTYRILQAVLINQKKPNAALEIAERGRARALVELLGRKSQGSETNNYSRSLPNIAEIQRIAKAQQATLVQYSITDATFVIEGKSVVRESKLYIWVISPNGQITFREVDLIPLWHKQSTSLDELVENSRKGIGVNDRDSTGIKIVLNPEYRQQLRQEQSKYLRQLHQILIEPIADLLPTDPNARVVFMPQSALYLVPFAALQDKSEQYLIQKHTIAISPSIQVLSLTQQQRLALPTASARSSQNILIAGNPVMPKVFVPGIDQPLRLDDLQGAQKEAIAVANTLKTTALTGNQATKKAVVQQMQSARIIHLATHGLLDDFKGLGVPGAIALAPDGDGSNNDGLLTADEILGMKLKAELVVLSACNTGRGKITGDGVIGLSRSLISAGVPSIIVSLWSVPDAPTAELMSDFYTLLEQNPDKAQALRQAMLKTMKTHPDPRDWAAFTLIGES